MNYSRIMVVFLTAAIYSNPGMAQIDYRYAVGLQVTLPSWGISAKTHFTDRLAFEFILGPVDTQGTFALKGLYGITKDRFLHSYIYGLSGLRIGHYKANGVYGFGLGLEHNWQQWDAKLPPIWFNLEAGAGYRDTVYPVLGIGAHYWFNF